MQNIDQFFLVLFALMGLGLLVAFSSLKQGENTRLLNNWWSLSVGLYSGALFTFTLIPWLHSAIQTLANVAMMGAMMLCAVLFRSWRQPVEDTLIRAVWFVLVLLGIGYEVLLQNAGFSERVFFVTTAFELSLVWQGYELVRLMYARGPHILKFIFFCVLLSLFLTLTRSMITLNSELSHALNIFQEESFTRFLRWSGLATMLLTFFGIGSFYLQRQSSERRQMIDVLASKDSALSGEIEEKNQVQQLLVERDELIQSLISAKKSAEVGALSAALAHELNQPLCAIQLNAECLQMELTSAAANPLIEQELLSRILSDNKRASEIIIALKQVFSNSGLVMQRVNLVDLMPSLETLFLPRVKRENISINRKYPITGGCYVEINPQEFQQVILNILNNAIHALSEITTHERRIEISISKKNGRAYVSVADNGSGIDPKRQASIFNLLSSTKFAGMGLGLWLSQHIIERHKGRIYLTTQSGWSTTFMIELPLNE